VQPGEGALDDPAVAAESRSVSALPACDHGRDAELADQTTVLVVVVAAIGEQPVGSSSWPAGAAANGRHPLEQLEELGDVVAVGAGQRPGERDPAGVYEQVVLASAPAAVNRARTCFGAPFFACR
jgi:hypothetical protein